MFVSSKKMAADAAATRRARNEAHDKMSLSKQEAFSKKEKHLLELKLIGKNAEIERVRAVKAAVAASLAVENAQQRLVARGAPRISEKQALVNAWERLSAAAAEARRTDQYEHYKGRFNIFRRAVNSIQQADYKKAIDAEENAKEKARQTADLLVLKNEALNAKNAENAKAKLAAVAARDLATANDKLYLKSPTAVSKEQATYAAFERANDAALEASKNRQLGLYSKTDPEHDTSTAPVVDNVKPLGAKNLAAAAAIQRNAELKEEAKSRDFAALPIERVLVLAEIARDKVTQIQAQSDLAMERNREVKQKETEKLQVETVQAEIAKDTARSLKSKSDQVNHQRSSLAFANLQRLQLKQDAGDAKKIKSFTTASAQQKEDIYRTQTLSKAQSVVVTHDSLRGLGSAELAA